MKRKSTILTIIFGLLTTLGFSQTDLTGTYQAWFDICDRNYKHFSMTLEIDPSDTVNFTYQDDTQRRTATGILKITNDTIDFEPLTEKDSKFIEGYFGESTIWVNNGVLVWTQPCPELDRINIFRKTEKK